MANYYIYLISSLPFLQFGMKPPFMFEKFLKQCAEFIPDEDLKVLKRCSIDGEYQYEGMPETLKRWRAFDTALRNEIAKVRAGYKHIDPAKYLRRAELSGPSLSHIAMNAHRSPLILEGERLLDEARWRALDELAIGHYFDIDFLIVYSHKLLLLEKWENIRMKDRARLVEDICKLKESAA